MRLHRESREQIKRKLHDFKFKLKSLGWKRISGALGVVVIVSLVVYWIWSPPRCSLDSGNLWTSECVPETEYCQFKASGGGKVTMCPDTSWIMNRFSAADGHPDKTVIVIGCNKGADAVDWFSMFDNMETPFNSSLWRRSVRAQSDDSGACNQIMESSQVDRGHFDPNFERMSPTVYCVEPMPSTIELLRKCSKETGINEDFFKIQHYAVGDPKDNEMTVQFPDGRPGQEALGIQLNKPRVETVAVPFVSLDALFGHLSKVDILSIDAEGHDPEVIFAGKETLRKTRYLEFETHRDLEGTPWKFHTLKSVIDFLDDLSFDCFWINGNGQLFQITNCWHSLYEEESKTWSNVICAKRKDEWHGLLTMIRGTQSQSRN